MMPDGGWMCHLTRYYETWCGWVWLDDGGRWQPVWLPGHHANPPECIRLAEAVGRLQERQGLRAAGTDCGCQVRDLYRGGNGKVAWRSLGASTTS
jgi:hypothetical protein